MSVLILFPPFLCPASLLFCSSASDIVLIINDVQPGKHQVGYQVRGIAREAYVFTIHISLMAKCTNVAINGQLSEYKDSHESSPTGLTILVLFPILY